MVIVVVSGLISLAVTQSFLGTGWARNKALLGLSVFEASLLIGGSGRRLAELDAAAADPALLDTLLLAERNTLWLLIAAGVANVVLAVWRPRLKGKTR